MGYFNCTCKWLLFSLLCSWIYQQHISFLIPALIIDSSIRTIMKRFLYINNFNFIMRVWLNGWVQFSWVHVSMVYIRWNVHLGQFPPFNDCSLYYAPSIWNYIFYSDSSNRAGISFFIRKVWKVCVLLFINSSMPGHICVSLLNLLVLVDRFFLRTLNECHNIIFPLF